MKKVKLITEFLKASVLLCLIAALCAMHCYAGVSIVLIATVLPTPKNVALGVVKEVWTPYIIERFWKDNPFLKNAYDDSGYVLQGRIVHIPQPGSKPAVVKNRSSWPGTAVRRTDTDVTYSLDEYSTDPSHIPNIDSIHLSYSKMDSVLGDHMSTLNETVADDMLIKWGANGTNVFTTGGSGATNVAAVAGQTGPRLALDQMDLLNLMITANRANVPKQDRFALIDDYMYAGFYNSLGLTTARDFSAYADAKTGVVGKLHGWNIMTRSSVLLAAANNSLKALGASIASTDNLVSLAWQKNSVAMAIGDTKLFENKDDALYYGDVYSALVMAGGRVRRTDGLGIYNIIQGTPA
jgi:hypothetical protein